MAWAAPFSLESEGPSARSEALYTPFAFRGQSLKRFIFSMHSRCIRIPIASMKGFVFSGFRQYRHSFGFALKCLLLSTGRTLHIGYAFTLYDMGIQQRPFTLAVSTVHGFASISTTGPQSSMGHLQIGHFFGWLGYDSL
jgi:hypothetical protein